MRPEIPNWAEVFVFGSASNSGNPKDLDLLVVYDPAECPPSQARDKAEVLALELARDLKLQPHVVVLTKSEEEEVRFIQSEGCVEFDSWLKSRADNLNRRTSQ
jgi:predicted nucleotidyltransferase